MCARSRVWDVPIQIRENLINLMGKYRQKKNRRLLKLNFRKSGGFFRLQTPIFQVRACQNLHNFVSDQFHHPSIFFCLYFCLKTTSFQGISITPPELRDLAHTTLLHKVTCFFLDLASQAFRVLADVESYQKKIIPHLLMMFFIFPP